MKSEEQKKIIRTFRTFDVSKSVTSLDHQVGSENKEQNGKREYVSFYEESVKFDCKYE